MHLPFMTVVNLMFLGFVAGLVFILIAKAFISLFELRVSTPEIFDAGARRRRTFHDLTKDERKIFNKARDLTKQGKAKEASELLRSINMERWAVTVLESNGHVEDAAQILEDLGAFERAGILYGAHGRWEKAAYCFGRAKDFAQAALCYREAGDFLNAAFYFDMAGHVKQAAHHYMKTKDHKVRAMRLFLAGGYHEKAAQMIDDQLEHNDHALLHALDASERRILETFLSQTEKTAFEDVKKALHSKSMSKAV